jgi:diadenosine tetraphosphate (Ap4A) HIT family hydrolase
MDEAKCLACSLADGSIELPGGEIYSTEHWRVEHAVAPLGVGTLILKPIRHCLHLWDLRDQESSELGPLIHLLTTTIKDLLEPDQIYVCLWSHADWEPAHIHFVLQPSWNHLREQHAQPGPFLQADLFHANEMPDPSKIEEFAEWARRSIQGRVAASSGAQKEQARVVTKVGSKRRER